MEICQDNGKQDCDSLDELPQQAQQIVQEEVSPEALEEAFAI